MIAIYGAGQYGKNFYTIINKYEKVDLFIDKYKHGLNFKDIPVISLEDIKKYNIKKIYNSVSTYENEVLKDLNRENVYTFVETLKNYPEIIDIFIQEQYLWLGSKTYLDLNKIDKVKNLLKDKISVDFFNRWVNFRKTLDMKYYPHPTNSLKEQYFINGFIGNSKRFIDCGAYTGDTIKAFYNYNKDGKVISFEPNPENLNILKESSKGRDVLIYPLGVWSKSEILRFNPNRSASSISKDGAISVPVTSLDETVYNFKPDYIKMDIEGSELEALKGAKNIIKDFTPNLAIAIYHKAEDLWEIPLYINSINPNYDFYIRCHNHLCLETILYCKGKR